MPTLPETECATYPITCKGRKVYSFSGMLGMKLIDLHKRYIEWWQRKLGISDYALLWLSFFKGILIALLVIWLVK